jgi:hypothetical protein
VGRSQELEQIKSLLAPEGSKAHLTGMGGVGKSELAIQHAYGSFAFYRGGILRLDARQGLDTMALQVVTFCRGVFPDLTLPEDKSPTDLLPLCWSQWPVGANPPEPVLLILDDQRGDKGGYGAERKLLEGLPPRFRRLITQRETAPTNAQALELPLLEREASLELLALQAGEGGTDRLKAEEQAADGLCSEVGDLPLALVLLGARLAERPDLRLEQLLADLQAKGAAAKALQQAHPELGAKLGVVEALLISWEPLTDPAKSLLLLLSVMAPAVIPWELVEACRLPEQELEEGSAFGDQQAELLHAQLLERMGPNLYRLHPLVRQFIGLLNREMSGSIVLWRHQLARAVANDCRRTLEQFLPTPGKIKEVKLSRIIRLEHHAPHVHYVLSNYYVCLDLEHLYELTTYFFLLEGAQHVAAHLNTPSKIRHAGMDGAGLRVNRLGWVEFNEHQRCSEVIEKSFGYKHPVLAVYLIKWAWMLAKRDPVIIRLIRRALLSADIEYPSYIESLMSQSVSIVIQRYGPAHPITIEVIGNFRRILRNEGFTMPEIKAKLQALQPPT